MSSKSELLARLAQPVAQAQGLPNSAYTSWDFYHQERNTLFANSWASIAFGADIPHTGDVYPIDFMGLPLFAIRDNAHHIRVFHNVCSHRGHRLIAASGCHRGVIRCPYHSWTYGFDGILRGTPHIGGAGIHEAPGFDRSCHSLKPVRSAVWMDIIFVALADAAPDFAEFIQPVEQRWQPFWSDPQTRRLAPASTFGTLAMDLPANWKLAVENYCESYHLPWIHPGLNSYSKLEDHYNIDGERGYSGQGSTAYRFAEISGIELPGIATWPSDRYDQAEYIALYPNTLLGLQIDHFFALTIEPVAPDKSRERLQLQFVGEAADSPDYDAARKAVLEGWRVVFAEDIDAVYGMQQGRRSPAFGGGVFSPVMDVPTYDFHRWVADKLSRAAIT